MEIIAETSALSNKRLWAGCILSALPVLFLLFDSLGKFLKPMPVVEGTIRLGYPESVIVWLGFVLLVCTLLYVIPRTSVLGAILLTGYLGGAVAAHLRVGDSLFSILFPVFVGTLIWGGILLRDDRLALLFPLRANADK